MPYMDEKVCVNHPELDAQSRCTTCFKPICSDCIEIRNGQDFCSELCAAKFFATNKGVEEFIKKDQKRQFLARIKKTAIFIGFLVLGIVFFAFWRINKVSVDNITDQITNKVKELRKH